MYFRQVGIRSDCNSIIWEESVVNYVPIEGFQVVEEFKSKVSIFSLLAWNPRTSLADRPTVLDESSARSSRSREVKAYATKPRRSGKYLCVFTRVALAARVFLDTFFKRCSP